MDKYEFSEEQSRRVKAGLVASDKKGGRPRKEIDVARVLKWLNRGDPQTDIAHDQRMSVTTLKERMKESGIIKEETVYVLNNA